VADLERAQVAVADAGFEGVVMNLTQDEKAAAKKAKWFNEETWRSPSGRFK
jgi:hypothetical protein